MPDTTKHHRTDVREGAVIDKSGRLQDGTVFNAYCKTCGWISPYSFGLRRDADDDAREHEVKAAESGRA